MANANPAGGSGKTRRQTAKLTETGEKNIPEALTQEQIDQPATEQRTEKELAPYGRHADGRPFDKGPKLDPTTQSYLPALWTEEVESVDQFGNRRTHTIILEDR